MISRRRAKFRKRRNDRRVTISRYRASFPGRYEIPPASKCREFSQTRARIRVQTLTSRREFTEIYRRYENARTERERERGRGSQNEWIRCTARRSKESLRKFRSNSPRTANRLRYFARHQIAVTPRRIRELTITTRCTLLEYSDSRELREDVAAT